VAQALMGSRAGDEVEIPIPAGVRKLRVDSVS
jgi:transcription elongation GreA/GreB family factor